MATVMTFEEYIKNPSDSRSRIVGEADIAKSVYQDKYNKMILQCGGQINYILWKKEPERYIIYIQMPSEKTPKLYYDVMIEFTSTLDSDQRTGKLDAYKVRFFSNDPNFTFTFAHAFKKKGLLIPELVPKISQKALKEPPRVTNPNILSGYVKSLYFAYIFMRNKGLFNKLNWLQANPMGGMKNWVHQYVMDSEKKLLYAQNFQKVSSQKHIKVSSVDKDGLSKAAKAVDVRSKYVKTCENVKRTNAIQKERNRIKSVKRIGRK